MYKVQCGAFSEVNNVKNIAKTLNNMEYETYITGLNDSSNVQGIPYRVNCEFPNIRSIASLVLLYLHQNVRLYML